MNCKFLCVLSLIFLLIACVCADTAKTKEEGKRIERMVFGINESDYNDLNLTESQKKQIDRLLDDYTKNYKKHSEENKDKSIDVIGLEKEITDQIKSQNELYDKFKKILTKDQLRKYETAYDVKIAEQKVYLTKKFAAFDSALNFTDEQKKSVKNIINTYDGDLLKTEEDFIRILDEKQRLLYNHLKQRQMGQMINKPENKTENNTQNNSENNTENKDQNKTIIINNNPPIQPVIWWTFGNWNPRPIIRINCRCFDSYWDVCERRYVDWVYDRWGYDLWRYEERIYERGFIDGYLYDRYMYDKWINNPNDPYDYYSKADDWTNYTDYKEYHDYDKYMKNYDGYDWGTDYYDNGKDSGWSEYLKENPDWNNYSDDYYLNNDWSSANDIDIPSESETPSYDWDSSSGDWGTSGDWGSADYGTNDWSGDFGGYGDWDY